MVLDGYKENNEHQKWNKTSECDLHCPSVGWDVPITYMALPKNVKAILGWGWKGEIWAEEMTMFFVGDLF